MREYLKNFFQEYRYQAGDVKTLLDCYDRICSEPTANAALAQLLKAYRQDKEYPMLEQTPRLQLIADQTGAHLYTVEFLVTLCLSKTLAEYMRALGVADEIIRTTFCDFAVKLGECKDFFGVVGTDCWSWYCIFFRLELFGLGRLQFQIGRFEGENYEKNGKTLKKGDRVLSVHIPKTGEPLTQEACLRSFQAAKKFFADIFDIEDAAFTCWSWLLAPLNTKLLPKTSNIARFGAWFDLVGSGEYDENYNPVFRIVFNRPLTTPLDELPQNSSLQRAYAEHMKKGGKTGYGYGVFFLED